MIRATTAALPAGTRFRIPCITGMARNFQVPVERRSASDCGSNASRTDALLARCRALDQVQRSFEGTSSALLPQLAASCHTVMSDAVSVVAVGTYAKLFNDDIH